MPVDGRADDDGIRLLCRRKNVGEPVVVIVLAELVDFVVVQKERVVRNAGEERFSHLVRIAVWVTACVDEEYFRF